ncbi:MAG: DUF3570 domain-containing protein, partial [Bacteroidales bacterium]
MEANLAVVVAAINNPCMKNIVILSLLLSPFWTLAQTASDSTTVFKKRVLESTEVNILTSYYTQDGQNASVTGGIGSEKLDDFASDINVSIPLNVDDVLTINATISAYTSASSSNLNPFTGASNGPVTGTPWAASSGASREDVWISSNIGYSHSSNDRNSIYSATLSFANEYDYTSVSGGMGFVRLFNQKNTELSLNAYVYLDSWRPQYPTEIETYVHEDGDLNADFFQGVDILDQNGNIINKFGPGAWKPINTTLVKDKGRNTYVVSLGFSQILSRTTQMAIISDITYQMGWLSNPMQRVYFADQNNFYIGNATSIPFYNNPENKDVFQLADDIERLPSSRLKIPVGVRFNQYLNEFLVFRSYYRYYFDDWGIQSHTFDAELAIKLGQNFTIFPSYRFYNQTAADYFAPFEELLSTDEYYTSDYDLSKFDANQFGFGIKYNDIFSKHHIWKFGLKNLTLDYNYYKRNTG